MKHINLNHLKHRGHKNRCPECGRIIHKVCPLAPHIKLSTGLILRPIVARP